MTLCVDRSKNLSGVLALLALVAVEASGCDDSGPTDGPPSHLQGDAGTDRVDATAVDAFSADESSEEGSTEDTGTEDRSFQDRLSDDRSVDATSGDAESDADAAPDGNTGMDAVDAEVAVDAAAPDGDVRVDRVDTDGADADVDCTCTPDDSGGGGTISLACFCAKGGCPSYDDAISRCPYTHIPDDHRVDTYADCNLVVIRIPNSIGIGGSTFVYDATTHEFVGGSSAADTPGISCGGTSVFGIRAGTFPPPTCPRTQSLPRCVDGGDGD